MNIVEILSIDEQDLFHIGVMLNFVVTIVIQKVLYEKNHEWLLHNVIIAQKSLKHKNIRPRYEDLNTVLTNVILNIKHENKEIKEIKNDITKNVRSV